MTSMIVFKNVDGNVINIGDWDYMEEVSMNPDTGEEVVIKNNPLPEGAYSETLEVTTLPDGGLYAGEVV